MSLIRVLGLTGEEAMASSQKSEHRVGIFGGGRHGLQHIPVLDDFAVGIETKDIDAGGFLTKQVQVARMDKRQVAINGDAFYLVANASSLLEKAHDAVEPIRNQRIVLDVGTSDEIGIQIGPALVEDLIVDDVQRVFYVISFHISFVGL